MVLHLLRYHHRDIQIMRIKSKGKRERKGEIKKRLQPYSTLTSKRGFLRHGNEERQRAIKKERKERSELTVECVLAQGN